MGNNSTAISNSLVNLPEHRILIVDDDEQIIDILTLRLESDGYIVDGCNGIQEALKRIPTQTYSLILLDIRLKDGNGVEALPKIRALDSDVPLFIITAHGDIDSAIQAFSKGATGYIRKPFQDGELRAQIAKAISDYDVKLEIKRHKTSETAPQSQNLEDIILSRDPIMNPLLQKVRMAAVTHSSVIIYGPSGSGKELIAQALHNLSPRSSGPFVAINCGAFTETLLESELFGHSKGAFTDAKTDKVGHFVRADGGTLFLDEIGDAPPSVQVRLLRVLQEREVLPVGGAIPQKIYVRIIAATHRDLKSYISLGKFREDLFYRLQVLHLHVPALKERPSDILFLAECFANRLVKKNGEGLSRFYPGCCRSCQCISLAG